MYVDELIEKLIELKEKHGNLQCWLMINGDECRSADEVLLVSPEEHGEIDELGIAINKW